MYFYSFFIPLIFSSGISWKLLYLRGSVPYQSSAQMTCREEAAVSFVSLGPLEAQTANAIDCDQLQFAPFDNLSWKFIILPSHPWCRLNYASLNSL
jgi:hypothetical protein